jgi:hypothetical protein
MALQRTRRPRFRSGRLLRSLGSPLNARPLDALARSMLLIPFTLPACLFLSTHAFAQAEEAIQIRVMSRSDHFTGGVIGGFPARARTPQPTPLPELTGFRIDCSAPDCPDAVRTLLDSLETSAKPRLDPSDFEAILSWLGSATSEELRNALCTPWYKHLFDRLSSYRRTREAIDAGRRDRLSREQLLIDYYRGVSDHGGAVVAVTLRLPGGRVVELSSSAEHSFMIPWRIREGRSEYDTYDPAIGQALAALAPPLFEERERLSGGRLRCDLLGLLLDRIDHERSAQPY